MDVDCRVLLDRLDISPEIPDDATQAMRTSLAIVPKQAVRRTGFFATPLIQLQPYFERKNAIVGQICFTDDAIHCFLDLVDDFSKTAGMSALTFSGDLKKFVMDDCCARHQHFFQAGCWQKADSHLDQVNLRSATSPYYHVDQVQDLAVTSFARIMIPYSTRDTECQGKVPA